MTKRRLVVPTLTAVALLAGCGATNFPVAFTNDQAAAVTVRDCADCGAGHAVLPGQTWRLSMKANESMRVTRDDTHQAGCSVMSDGASTSDATLVLASSVLAGLCR